VFGLGANSGVGQQARRESAVDVMTPAVSTDGGAIPGLETRDRGLGSPAQAVALATLCVVLFLTFLDNTIVSAALGNIQSSLHASVEQLQWVVNGYALTFASLMLAFGSLGDRWGRKKMMLTGVAIFCAGSVVSAVANGPEMLIAGRVVMGVGAAASEPGTLSILRHVYPERGTRADALGVWAAVSALALALGPVIGGLLVGYDDWRAIFWFNLGVGALAFLMAAVFIPENSNPPKGRFDFIGVLLAIIVLGSLSTAVIEGETFGYGDAPISGLFALSFVAAIAFVLVERKVKNPVLDVRYFRRPAFVGSNFVAFAGYFGTFSIFFFTALYLEVVGNQSPYRLALDFVPMAGGMILASIATGPVVARIGPRWPMTIGCLLAGTGILGAAHVLSPTAAFGPLASTLAIAGVGFGIALVPVTSAALTLVPPERSGMAASATNTSRELGAVIGVAVLGSIVNAKLTGDLAAKLQAIGIPPKFQSVVIAAVTGGGLPSSGSAATKSSNAGVQKTINEVINAAYSAFGSGLHEALLVAGALILIGAVVAFVTIHLPGGETYEL